MNAQVSQINGKLVVQGEMTVETAATLWPALLSAVRARGGDARLMLGEVSLIDTAGLQLLLMIHRLAAASGSTFCILAPSAAVRSSLELVGLHGFIAASETAESGMAP